VIGAVGRRRAPVIVSPHLAAGEHAFLMLGLIPNRKGQPLIAEWRAVVRRGTEDYAIEDFDAFCARARIAERSLPSTGRPWTCRRCKRPWATPSRRCRSSSRTKSSASAPRAPRR
jgi:hypothetical protein